MADTKVIITEVKEKKRDFIYAVGRRRESVARIRLYEHVKDGLAWDGVEIKKGDILVNNKPITEFFSDPIMRYTYSEPFRITNTVNKYTITIQVSGGGRMGQLKAVVHGVSQALALVDEKKHRGVLKDKGFLTRDARVRERRKVGTGGKARRTKQSPKR
ncbi:MAG TPA: 30S ribosomal protein S9 [Patescibacteria group bacterium]|nr:30S ribosomal protein S9 [Patescibacteria group bacterium]